LLNLLPLKNLIVFRKILNESFFIDSIIYFLLQRILKDLDQRV